MIISGTHLNEHDVTALAGRLRECGFADAAERLEAAYWADANLFHLSDDDRDAFMSALDDCPGELLLLHSSIKDQLVGQPV